MSDEIKPCPFCGSKAETDLSDFGSAMVYCNAGALNIECPVNPETGFYDSIESAIAAWNMRPNQLCITCEFGTKCECSLCVSHPSGADMYCSHPKHKGCIGREEYATCFVSDWKPRTAV